MKFPVIRPAGDCSILVEFESRVDPNISAQISALENWLQSRVRKGIYDYIPGYNTLFFEYDPLVISYQEICSIVSEWQISRIALPKGRRIWVPVCYEGDLAPDIEDVAKYNHLTPGEVIGIHTGGDYFSYFMGFLPGFPFLGGMDARIATPRMPTPRQRVPGGSVGIAGEQTGFYPIDSPGGWRLIGRIPIRMYDRRRSDPFVVHAGDWLKFFSITFEEFQQIYEDDVQTPYPIEIEEGESEDIV